MDQLFVSEGVATGVSDKRGDIIDTSDEVFAFDRTLSRLKEMSAHEYLISAASSRRYNDTALLLYDSDSRISASEALALFKACDVDASGVLERPEIRLLLENVCERQKGHRNVLEEEVDFALERMGANADGEVSKYAFLQVVADRKFSKVLRFGGEETGS